MAVSTASTHSIDSRRGYALLLIVVGSIVISFGGVIQRNIEFADPWQVSFYRSLGMLLAAALIIIVQYRHRLYRTLVGIGGLGFAGGLLTCTAGITFVQALAHTTVANALFILGSIPFFAALFARIFLGEKLRTTTLLTMIAAAIGLGIMVARGVSVGSGFGNAMALITAVSFAMYAVIVRYKRKIEMVPVMILGSVLVMIVAAVVKSGELSIPMRDILLCLFWGGCLSGFVNWMFIIASRHLAAAEVTLIMLLEFSLGPLWVWIFVGEVPSAWTIAGGGLVIVAVALRAVFELLDRPKPEQTTSGPV